MPQRLPDLEGWAIFARVAERSSFAGAAAELGLSNATVSKAISRLEARIGAKLLSRTSRRVALTVLGRELAANATRLLNETEAMEIDAASQATGPRGTVRIAAPMSFGTSYLAPLLPALLALYPELRVELALSDEIVDLVAGGYDLAVRLSPHASGGGSLRVRRICGIEARLVASPLWVAGHGMPETPAGLGDEVFGYAYARTPGRLALRHDITGEEMSVPTGGRLRTNNGDIMLPALEAGAGVALLPEFIVWNALQRGTLVTLLEAWRAPAISLNLVMPPGHPRPLRVTVVIDFLAGRLGASPWARGTT